MKKQVEKYLPAALNAVRELLTTNAQQKEVYEEYDGYAASFGASIVTSGLLPTLSFYTDVHKKDTDGSGLRIARRYRILIALARILRQDGLSSTENDKTALLDFAIGKHGQAVDFKALQTNILAASIALKLALRNFKHVKSPAGHES